MQKLTEMVMASTIWSHFKQWRWEERGQFRCTPCDQAEWQEKTKGGPWTFSLEHPKGCRCHEKGGESGKGRWKGIWSWICCFNLQTYCRSLEYKKASWIQVTIDELNVNGEKRQNPLTGEPSPGWECAAESAHPWGVTEERKPQKTQRTQLGGGAWRDKQKLSGENGAREGARDEG